MGWANYALGKLALGQEVTIYPRGNSMLPHIKSGAEVVLAPFSEEPMPGDIVLCRVAGRQYLHFVKARRGGEDDRQYQIGNAHGGINGWVGRRNIFGKVIRVDGRERT